MLGPRQAMTFGPLRRAIFAMLLSLALVVTGWAPLGLAQTQTPTPTQDQNGARLAAILQGLDKTTARVSTVEAPIDDVARFGTLEIIARACHKKPPTETPESTAFLEIVDVRPDSPAISVFTGWMFASSPAVSAMEHPVYDIWVVDCREVAPAQEVEATGQPDSADTADRDNAAAQPKQE